MDNDTSAGSEDCRSLLDDLHKFCAPIISEYEDDEILTAMTFFYGSIIASIFPIKLEDHSKFIWEINAHALELVSKFSNN